MRSSRISILVVLRWADMLTLGLVSSILGLALVCAIGQAPESLYHSRISDSLLTSSALSITSFCCCLLVAHRLRAFGFGIHSWTTSLRYPPCWWMSVPGTALVVMMLASMGERAATGTGVTLASSDLQWEIPWDVMPRWTPAWSGSPISEVDCASAALFVLATLSTQILRIGNGLTNSGRATTTTSGSVETGAIDSLEYWLQSEVPVRSIEDDALGRVSISDRIAQRLLDGRPHGVELLGDFGTGKSSIIEMVWSAISAEGKVQAGTRTRGVASSFVRVDVAGWGLDGLHANRRILDAMLEATSKYVDCAAISGLSEDYATAMGSSAPQASRWLLPVLRSRLHYEAQISRLDTALHTADIRLLVVIEDLDRQRRRGAGRSSDILRDLNAVEGLLDKIRATRRISFIVADGGPRGMD